MWRRKSGSAAVRQDHRVAWHCVRVEADTQPEGIPGRRPGELRHERLEEERIESRKLDRAAGFPGYRNGVRADRDRHGRGKCREAPQCMSPTHAGNITRLVARACRTR